MALSPTGWTLLFALEGGTDLFAKYPWLLASHVATITFGYCLAYLIGGMGICYFVQNRLYGVTAGQAQTFMEATERYGRASAILIALGFVLGLVWAHFAMAGAWTWRIQEVGAVAALVWMLMFTMAHRLPSATPQLITFLALIGNGIVSVSWSRSFPMIMLTGASLLLALLPPRPVRVRVE